MKLKALRLINFRNYSDEAICFSPHINCLYGENAQGKTSILEAIYLICNGRSFRTPHLKDVIQKGKTFFRIEAKIEKNNVLHTLSQTFDGKQRSYLLNDKKFHSFAKLLNAFPAVIHTPKDTELITGAPGLRRRLLDIQISQSNTDYLLKLTRYYRALKHRNALLKNKNSSSIHLFENEMANSSQYIITQRNAYIKTLTPVINSFQQELTFSLENYSVSYESFSKNFNDFQKEYISHLNKTRSLDEKYLSTQTGLHKDDYQFYVDDALAKNFASEGQKKSFIAALKLALHQTLSKALNTQIIMMIDDFNAHLDPQRLSAYFESLKNIGQVFLTQPTNFPFSFEKIQHYHVKKGSVKAL